MDNVQQNQSDTPSPTPYTEKSQPTPRTIRAADDARITAKIRDAAGCRNPCVEFVDERGDCNGPRQHSVPSRGWYALSHWVSVNVGSKENPDFDGRGHVVAIFQDGRLVGFEGDRGIQDAPGSGSHQFVPASLIRAEVSK